MRNKNSQIRLAGLLLIVAMVAGIFSVAPSVDSSDYLTAAANNSNEVIIAAVFQLIMGVAYIGFAILLYPSIKKESPILANTFLSFRIIATLLVIVGTLVLLNILWLSKDYVLGSLPKPLMKGDILRALRDEINHVYMIVILCSGNIMLYVLLIKSKLIPVWLSVWGIVGALLSITASILVLFKVLDIITAEYLTLNALTGLQEIVLAIWLMIKGFK